MKAGRIFPPGAHIGLLGGGQLARMTALAGRRLGYQFSVFDPAGLAAPAAPVCEQCAGAPFDDNAALADFARGLDVIGFEFENIPVTALQTLEQFCPVRPRWQALEICQHREREKVFLERHGYPHAAFRIATNAAELAAAMRELGVPCVLKTAQSGYDGKGQLRIEPGRSAEDAWQEWSGGKAWRGVVEAWVDFDAELSVICARNGAGELVPFAAIENVHTHHILDVSIAPARFPERVLAQAAQLASAITETLEIEGLLAVEMFWTKAGELVVNELAPRPHNSGHLTFDASVTSQFEQHVRAICGLPLGSAALLTPVVMVNLLGHLWKPDGQPPDWLPVLAEPAAKLHLYGKHKAKPGRKMGHFCVLDRSREAALAKALTIKARLAEQAAAGDR